MTESVIIKQLPKQKKFLLLLLLLSIFILLFTLCKTYTNVYTYAFVGTLFEMAWLPWLLGIFILPLFTIWHIYKTKTLINKWVYFALAIQIVSLLILVFN